MLVIRRLIWDSWNVAHIARHQVKPEEVEEVCHGDPIAQEGRGGRSLVIGPTRSGKILTVVIDPEGQDLYYPVTARRASRREQAIYQHEKEEEVKINDKTKETTS